MKKLLPVAILATALLSGCSLYSTTDFQPYEAKSGVLEGQGGTKESIDGVDFWANGEPPRKFKVLGVITDKRLGNPLTMSSMKGAVALKAKQTGGSAVVWSGESERHGDYVNSKFVVIKYLD